MDTFSIGCDEDEDEFGDARSCKARTIYHRRNKRKPDTLQEVELESLSPPLATCSETQSGMTDINTDITITKIPPITAIDKSTETDSPRLVYADRSWNTEPYEQQHASTAMEVKTFCNAETLAEFPTQINKKLQVNWRPKRTNEFTSTHPVGQLLSTGTQLGVSAFREIDSNRESYESMDIEDQKEELDEETLGETFAYAINDQNLTEYHKLRNSEVNDINGAADLIRFSSEELKKSVLVVERDNSSFPLYPNIFVSSYNVKNFRNVEVEVHYFTIGAHSVLPMEDLQNAAIVLVVLQGTVTIRSNEFEQDDLDDVVNKQPRITGVKELCAEKEGCAFFAPGIAFSIENKSSKVAEAQFIRFPLCKCNK